MEAVLSGILPSLLLFALAAASEPTASSAPTTVQQPFNLKKKSYNFNTTLSWDYNVTSVTPYFQVEYRNDDWTIVETCANISRNFCDLSKEIIDPYAHYAVRVKAILGSEMSEYAKTEFYLINDGIIGPPTLNASVDEHFINVDVWYPLVDGERNVGHYLEDLTYDVYYRNETEETDECDEVGCSVKFLLTNQSKYCFSAQGKSYTVPMTMEKSKDICIVRKDEINDASNTLYAAIISISIVVIILMTLSFFIIKRKIEAKPMLPVSLNTIAKVMTTRINLPSSQMTKYDQVSISPIDSEKMTPEETEKDLKVSDDPDIGESIGHECQSSVSETELKADEGQNGNEEPSSSRNYYRTENSDSSSLCMVEDDVTKQEPIRDIKPVTNSYGYDKPHCPS